MSQKPQYRVTGHAEPYDSVTAALVAAFREIMQQEGHHDLPQWLADNSRRHNWLTLTCSGCDGVTTSQVTISEE
jgi:hypothetical protein